MVCQKIVRVVAKHLVSAGQVEAKSLVSAGTIQHRLHVKQIIPTVLSSRCSIVVVEQQQNACGSQMEITVCGVHPP